MQAGHAGGTRGLHRGASELHKAALAGRAGVRTGYTEGTCGSCRACGEPHRARGGRAWARMKPHRATSRGRARAWAEDTQGAERATQGCGKGRIGSRRLRLPRHVWAVQADAIHGRSAQGRGGVRWAAVQLGEGNVVDR